MINLIIKHIQGAKLEESDFYDILYEICDHVHASCDSECPVYEISKGIPWTYELDNCLCFKDGKKMYDFIASHKDVK